MHRGSPRSAHSRRQVAAATAEHALAELLKSRPFRGHRVSRHCAIGPYVVDYVYSERALVVELQEGDPQEADSRLAVRHAFLAAMGYTVICIPHKDVLRRPLVVREQIRAALGRA